MPRGSVAVDGPRRERPQAPACDYRCITASRAPTADRVQDRSASTRRSPTALGTVRSQTGVTFMWLPRGASTANSMARERAPRQESGPLLHKPNGLGFDHYTRLPTVAVARRFHGRLRRKQAVGPPTLGLHVRFECPLKGNSSRT